MDQGIGRVGAGRGCQCCKKEVQVQGDLRVFPVMTPEGIIELQIDVLKI